MSVLVIREHKRFAVCRRISLLKDQSRAATGSLIEISLGGCRISRLDYADINAGETFQLDLEGLSPIKGEVRWARGNCLGLRFEHPLHHSEMRELLEVCGSLPPASHEPARAYGA